MTYIIFAIAGIVAVGLVIAWALRKSRPRQEDAKLSPGDSWPAMAAVVAFLIVSQSLLFLGGGASSSGRDHDADFVASFGHLAAALPYLAGIAVVFSCVVWLIRKLGTTSRENSR